ncbi:uncharacterized protein LOC135401481 [Ornithodoros turicata]|uniref:uncharacterized protein LOC135401481 n=1 Tax=Ornithodoros turicata TaxID=34597 RepID=UPI003138D961
MTTQLTEGNTVYCASFESRDSGSIRRSESCILHSHAGEETALDFASVKNIGFAIDTYSPQGTDFAGVSNSNRYIMLCNQGPSGDGDHVAFTADVKRSALDQEHLFSEEEMEQTLKFQEQMFLERMIQKDQEWSEKHKKMRQRLEVQDSVFHEMSKHFKEISRICDDDAKERQLLIADVTKLVKERDELMEDLRGAEAAFSEVHRRNERAKDAIGKMKENETMFEIQLTEVQTMLERRNNMLCTLRTKVEESTETANKEIESSRKLMDAENTVLKAQLNKAEMKINSLKKHLEQKTEENSQLTQMYDDLLCKIQHN